ncbi:hypothetical protein BTVI_106865 [Pitangus sulphuratus]|nr:hypothetical protein BTVI_106865 [Pitangus sulphuratus]
MSKLLSAIATNDKADSSGEINLLPKKSSRAEEVEGQQELRYTTVNVYYSEAAQYGSPFKDDRGKSPFLINSAYNKEQKV